MNGDRLNLPNEGQSMDKVYEAFAGCSVGYMAPKAIRISSVWWNLKNKSDKMTRIADALQKKVGLEKQVNRQLGDER